MKSRKCDCYVPRRDWCHQLDFPEGCYYAKSKTRATVEETASQADLFAILKTVQPVKEAFNRTFGKR